MGVSGKVHINLGPLTWGPLVQTTSQLKARKTRPKSLIRRHGNPMRAVLRVVCVIMYAMWVSRRGRRGRVRAQSILVVEVEAVFRCQQPDITINWNIMKQGPNTKMTPGMCWLSSKYDLYKIELPKGWNAPLRHCLVHTGVIFFKDIFWDFCLYLIVQ